MVVSWLLLFMKRMCEIVCQSGFLFIYCEKYDYMIVQRVVTWFLLSTHSHARAMDEFTVLIYRVLGATLFFFPKREALRIQVHLSWHTNCLFPSKTDKIIPPTFSRKLKDCDTIVGEAGEMECKVSGSPPFTISWYHNDEEIASGPNYEISFSDNNCVLRVPTLKLTDTGVYKCKAVNKAGLTETTASLVVRGQYPRQTELKASVFLSCLHLTQIINPQSSVIFVNKIIY